MTVNAAFFERVSHDFRGELATIVNGVHFVLRYADTLSSAARQMLERVAGACARLKSELDEFDGAAWLVDQPPQRLSLGPCSVDRVLGIVMERFRRSPRGYRAGVVVEPCPAELV